MNTFKLSTISLFLGLVSANEFLPESKQDLFKLDEDDLIINPSKPQKQIEKNDDLFINEDNLIKEATEENKPVEKVLDQVEIKDAPTYTDQAQKIWELMTKIQNEEQPQEANQELIDPQNAFVDEDDDIRNHVHPMKDASQFRSHRTVSISDNRRPIYGILTEPLRGNLKNKNKASGDYFDHSQDEVSYIPKTHVQFLE